MTTEQMANNCIREYFTKLSDAQVEKEIYALNAFQREKFEESLLILGDRRHALFIAKSWPENWTREGQ